MEKIKAELERLAACKASCDDENFMVNDYAGGNIDDAYSLGQDDGEIMLARNLLKLIQWAIQSHLV